MNSSKPTIPTTGSTSTTETKDTSLTMTSLSDWAERHFKVLRDAHQKRQQEEHGRRLAARRKDNPYS